MPYHAIDLYPEYRTAHFIPQPAAQIKNPAWHKGKRFDPKVKKSWILAQIPNRNILEELFFKILLFLNI